MNETAFLIKELFPIKAERDYPLSLITGYGTGGSCDVAVFPKTPAELVFTLKTLKGKIPFFVIGNGSNVLASDKGYKGAVIVTSALDKINMNGNLLLCECGVKMSRIIKEMSDNSFGGLEFACGIPATVGGAVAMNAGCYNKSVSDAVKYVITDGGTFVKKDCGFGYRTSRFLNGETIIKVCFLMDCLEEDVIEERLARYKRLRKNPKGRSCGSVFKNDGFFAGKLIDLAGLKGIKTGGARVSEKHANFIINEGGSSSDVYALIKLIKKQVLKVHGVNLKEEIKYIGKFDD